MSFLSAYPYLSLIVLILMVNFVFKKVTRSEHSPIVRLILFLMSAIAQACSPFSGPVNESISDSYYYSKLRNDVCYSRMGNWFALGNSKLNADAGSFEVIARDFARDKDHLYFQDKVIDKEADIASFEVAKGDYYCYDKDHVYIPFEYLPHEFNSRYQKDNQLWVVEKANPETFEKIDFRWSKDDRHYFFYYRPAAIDYPTFEVLNENFAKDKNRIYLLKSFELLAAPAIDAPSARAWNERYAADKENVYDFQEYRDGQEVDSLIAISYKGGDFRIIEKDYILFDDKVVYDGVEIENADVATFQFVKGYYTKDRYQVYCAGKSIEGADPGTFEVFEYLIYSKDKNHVYYDGKILKEADAATFGPPEKDSFLYRDKYHTFRGNEIINVRYKL